MTILKLHASRAVVHHELWINFNLELFSKLFVYKIGITFSPPPFLFVPESRR